MRKYLVIHRNEKGQWHKEDGPAVIDSFNTKHWYSNGQRHREDGPAIEFAGGTVKYFLKGRGLTATKFRRLQAQKLHQLERQIIL